MNPGTHVPLVRQHLPSPRYRLGGRLGNDTVVRRMADAAAPRHDLWKRLSVPALDTLGGQLAARVLEGRR